VDLFDVSGRQATKLKRLAGRTALALQADDIAALRKLGIESTDDSFKYNKPTVSDSHNTMTKSHLAEVPTQTENGNLYTTVKGLFVAKERFVDDLSVVTDEIDTVGVVLEHTSFYAEAGGQVADTGFIALVNEDGSQTVLDVIDVQVMILIPYHIWPLVMEILCCRHMVATFYTVVLPVMIPL
jgi:alanyl-tRNA synthetase